MAQLASGNLDVDGWHSLRPRRLPFRNRIWLWLWMWLLPPEGRKTAPTVTGLILILICIGLGLAAYQAGGGGGNILFMSLSMLLSGIILSGLLSMVNFRGLRWRLRVPQHMRVGETADIALEVANAKHVLPSYGIQVELEALRSDTKHHIFLTTGLSAQTQLKRDWTLTPKRRGREQLRVAKLTSSYPFGFLRKSIDGNTDCESIVLPQRIEYEFLPQSGRLAHRSGRFVRRPGTGDQLYNIRRYQRGDHQRLVHWKATARMRRMMVRQLMEEKQDGYLLDVEVIRTVWQDDAQLETLVSFAASLAEDLVQQDRLLAFRINGDGPHPVARHQDLILLLERLAVLEPVASVETPMAPTATTIQFAPSTPNGVTALLNGHKIGYAQ